MAQTVLLELPRPSLSALAELTSENSSATSYRLYVTRHHPDNTQTLLLLAKGLQSNTAIQSLSVDGCSLTPTLTYLVCEIVAAMGNIKELRICDCPSSVGGAFEGIAIALKAHPSLQSINLSGLSLCNAGAAAIASAAACMPCLTQLCLNECGIGDAGALALATALAGHEALSNLELLSNPISPCGSRALVHAMLCCPRRPHLSLPFTAYDFYDLVWYSRARAPVGTSSSTVAD